MNLLIDALPDSVAVSHKDYQVHTDFRVFVLFELLMHDPKIQWNDKMETALTYFYGDNPPTDKEAAIRQMLWFYRCGKDQEAKIPKGGKSEHGPAYSFERDDGAIVAAFYEKYQIDLTTATMHWWKFCSFLEPILSGTGLTEIVKCRITDVKGMGKAQAAYYREMKALYRIDRAQGRYMPLTCEARNQEMIHYVEKRYRECSI